tara:strand:+ start:7470 stop:7973 length:504 start_codon:yes stop_codon:yes gene_type:complete
MGDSAKLLAGSRVIIAQARGGSVTVRYEDGLYRVSSRDVDALGERFVKEFNGDDAIPTEEGTVGSTTDQIWNTLRTCYDPEIPVNIVDLGLIYDLEATELGDGRSRVEVKMTLTAQGCGMGPVIAEDARTKIESLPEVASADVQIVWDPKWTPNMISREGRQVLGID